MLTNLNTILSIVADAKQSGLSVVFTNGCFDIVHPGHCKYLQEAKKLGDILIVGVNTDSSVRRLKGENRPINNQDDRAFVLASLKPIDYVVLFDEDTPLNLISAILPDVLVKGDDYNVENIVGGDAVTANGGKVITIPLVSGKSTTSIIEKMC